MSSWDKQTAPVTNKLFLKLLQVEEQMGLCSPHKHAAAGGLVAEFCPTLMIPWTVARQAPLSRGFYRGEYWSGLPCLPPEDLPDPGTERPSLMSRALAGEFFITSATWKALFTARPPQFHAGFFSGCLVLYFLRFFVLPR